jgi:hypothetical protein
LQEVLNSPSSRFFETKPYQPKNDGALPCRCKPEVQLIVCGQIDMH